MRWAFPSEPAECGLYFIVSGTVDGAPIQQVLDGRSREHRFDNNPAEDWSLHIRAANRLGTGPLASPVRLSEGRQGRFIRLKKKTLKNLIIHIRF